MFSYFDELASNTTADWVTFTEEILNGKLHFFVQRKGLNKQFNNNLSAISFFENSARHRKFQSKYQLKVI